MDRKELGYLAENIAARYLEGRGYEILDKNYRKPWGEIDIVALQPRPSQDEQADERIVVFIEVKANKQETAGFNPEIRADWNKMQKIKRTAMLYMEQEMGDTSPIRSRKDPQRTSASYGLNREWQIDVIAVTFDLANKKAKLKHFKNV